MENTGIPWIQTFREHRNTCKDNNTGIHGYREHRDTENTGIHRKQGTPGYRDTGIQRLYKDTEYEGIQRYREHRDTRTEHRDTWTHNIIIQGYRKHRETEIQNTQGYMDTENTVIHGYVQRIQEYMDTKKHGETEKQRTQIQKTQGL